LSSNRVHGRFKAMYKMHTGVLLELFPVVQRTFFRRHCNFKRWQSAANYCTVIFSGPCCIASVHTIQKTWTVAPLLLFVCGCGGSMFSEPFPSSGLICWFCYFAFQVSCHNILQTVEVKRHVRERLGGGDCIVIYRICLLYFG
jgi:hypothetical protein